ncbi:MAG: serine/threonine-protein kinase [Kofleriaceae bacterium]
MSAREDGVVTSTLDLEGERPATHSRVHPKRLGDYQVLEPIAGGGMGFVYAGYDPALRRKVALKVLHAHRRDDEVARSRLMKEAQALGQLHHPNVVAVHRIFAHETQLVIVMEHVAGETLAAWETAAPRTWGDVLAVYAQAGDGLVAAHALGIVHRDFKPSNAIIGTDGHVRVVDFGLARITSDAEDTLPLGASPARIPLAQTTPGRIVGTPAYASPEQLAGESVTAASDQFSFCVALHCAVEGIAPFTGSFDDLAQNIRTRPPRLATDGRRIPAWLRALIRRGLAPEPADRHPSMTALLAELRRPRGFRRWRWPALAAGFVATTVTTSMLVFGGTPDGPTCDGDPDAIAAIWGPAQRASIETALDRIATPYAADVKARVLAGLDRFAEQWISARTTACLDHRSGTDSDTLFDRKQLCLSRRIDDLTSAVHALSDVQTANVASAVDVVAGFPSFSGCSDAALLLDDVAPPTVAQLPPVQAVRRQISDAAALDRLGRHEQAEAIAKQAIADAQPIGYNPLLAEAQLALGRIYLVENKLELATPMLSSAMQSALATGQRNMAVEAGARRLYAATLSKPDIDRLRSDAEYLEALAQSLPRDRFARPLLLNNIGAAYSALGEEDHAIAYFQRARDLIKSDPDPNIELVAIAQNLGTSSPDPIEREVSTKSVWVHLERMLGPYHRYTLLAHETYALFSANAREAATRITPVCDSYRVMHPTLVHQFASCMQRLATIATDLGDRKLADSAWAATIQATDRRTEPLLVSARRLAQGELALARNLPLDRAALGALILEFNSEEFWWQRQPAFHAELLLGLSDDKRNQHLAAAANGYSDVVRRNFSIVYRIQLSRAQRALRDGQSSQ